LRGDNRSPDRHQKCAKRSPCFASSSWKRASPPYGGASVLWWEWPRVLTVAKVRRGRRCDIPAPFASRRDMSSHENLSTAAASCRHRGR
jgi:hypothetical protein